MKKSIFTLAFAGLFGLAASAGAATITFTADKALAKTDFLSTLVLGKFDTNLGTLTGISFGLSGYTEGTGKTESQNLTPSTVTLTLGSTFTLSREGNSILAVTNPVYTKTFDFTSFDGTLDFAGTSGGSTGLLNHTQADSVTSTNASDFSAFSSNGGGFINLDLAAVAKSRATGAGNLTSVFTTKSSASVDVTYIYSPVPEPETYAMMLAGIGMLAFARRRKTAKKIS